MPLRYFLLNENKNIVSYENFLINKYYNTGVYKYMYVHYWEAAKINIKSFEKIILPPEWYLNVLSIVSI